MEEVEQEMMQNILRHVKASPYPHGPQALRVLGKLAGRNRRFLKTPLTLKSVTIPFISFTMNYLTNLSLLSPHV